MDFLPQELDKDHPGKKQRVERDLYDLPFDLWIYIYNFIQIRDIFLIFYYANPYIHPRDETNNEMERCFNAEYEWALQWRKSLEHRTFTLREAPGNVLAPLMITKLVMYDTTPAEVFEKTVKLGHISELSLVITGNDVEQAQRHAKWMGWALENTTTLQKLKICVEKIEELSARKWMSLTCNFFNNTMTSAILKSKSLTSVDITNTFPCFSTDFVKRLDGSQHFTTLAVGNSKIPIGWLYHIKKIKGITNFHGTVSLHYQMKPLSKFGRDWLRKMLPHAYEMDNLKVTMRPEGIGILVEWASKRTENGISINVVIGPSDDVKIAYTSFSLFTPSIEEHITEEEFDGYTNICQASFKLAEELHLGLQQIEGIIVV